MEAWENWIRSDFLKDIETYLDTEDLDEELEEDQLFELFRDLAERTNTYGHCETGGGWYIDVGRIAAAVTEDDIKHYLPS